MGVRESRRIHVRVDGQSGQNVHRPFLFGGGGEGGILRNEVD